MLTVTVTGVADAVCVTGWLEVSVTVVVAVMPMVQVEEVPDVGARAHARITVLDPAQHILGVPVAILGIERLPGMIMNCHLI